LVLICRSVQLQPGIISAKPDADRLLAIWRDVSDVACVFTMSRFSALIRTGLRVHHQLDWVFTIKWNWRS
jgi:hypothetical protein